MAKDFDKIIKENLKEVIDVLIHRVLKINAKRTIILESNLQITDEREADFILKVEAINEGNFVLHLEFQSNNDNTMSHRMLRYFAYIYQTYKLPVRQYVIYMGKDKLRMINKIELHNIQYRYELIDMRDISCEMFLESENPAEIILSILCDFKKKKKRLIVREILLKLKERVEGEVSFSKYIRQLEVISQLRDLQEIVFQEKKEVSLIFDIKKDPNYKEGIKEGREEGEIKGEITMLEQLYEKGRLNEQEYKEILLPLQKKLDELLDNNPSW